MEKTETHIDLEPAFADALYAYTGQIAGAGAAEIVTFDENGKEFYDC